MKLQPVAGVRNCDQTVVVLTRIRHLNGLANSGLKKEARRGQCSAGP